MGLFAVQLTCDTCVPLGKERSSILLENTANKFPIVTK